MAKYLDSAGATRLVTKLKTDVIPSVKVNAAKAADTVPASGITGVIDISHIPQGALERASPSPTTRHATSSPPPRSSSATPSR